MKREKILITEDDESIRFTIATYLKILNYETHEAENGLEAIEKLEQDKNGFNVLLTDLDMPKMGGRELIEKIKDVHPELVIMVITSHDESDVIIDIMKKGVFDYVIKPVNKNDLVLKVKRAAEASVLRREKLIYEKEKILRLESQINWFNYKEQSKTDNFANQEEAKKNLFTNLKTHLGQGMGFGLLTSIGEMITMCPKDKEGNFLISPEIMELVEINTDYARKVISYFSNLEKIFEEGIPLQNVDLSKLITILKANIAEQIKYAISRDVKIILSENKLPTDVFIKSNWEYLKEIFGELIINAIKYSEKDSTISILCNLEENKFTITFMNKVYKYNQTDSCGIKEEYQNLIFEPFFRIDKGITEESNSLNYGLGLTKVKMVLDRMNASIQVTNIKDFLSNSPSIKAAFIITFPLGK
ncbi:MAG: response regulator [Leptospiraceae bacterium]|nr:response regulator [Leptospiraceae bacterium]